VTVSFTILSNMSGANLSAGSAITNGSGQASVIYTAGTTPGTTDTISASAPSGIGYNVSSAISITVN
jgi:hypothetical protein